jgi:hypothetical protein
MVQALEVKDQTSLQSKTLFATLQRIANMDATRYPGLDRRLLSAMPMSGATVRDSE